MCAHASCACSVTSRPPTPRSNRLDVLFLRASKAVTLAAARWRRIAIVGGDYARRTGRGRMPRSSIGRLPEDRIRDRGARSPSGRTRVAGRTRTAAATRSTRARCTRRDTTLTRSGMGGSRWSAVRVEADAARRRPAILRSVDASGAARRSRCDVSCTPRRRRSTRSHEPARSRHSRWRSMPNWPELDDEGVAETCAPSAPRTVRRRSAMPYYATVLPVARGRGPARRKPSCRDRDPRRVPRAVALGARVRRARERDQRAGPDASTPTWARQARRSTAMRRFRFANWKCSGSSSMAGAIPRSRTHCSSAAGPRPPTCRRSCANSTRPRASKPLPRPYGAGWSDLLVSASSSRPRRRWRGRSRWQRTWRCG